MIRLATMAIWVAIALIHFAQGNQNGFLIGMATAVILSAIYSKK